MAYVLVRTERMELNYAGDSAVRHWDLLCGVPYCTFVHKKIKATNSDASGRALTRGDFAPKGLPLRGRPR